VVDEFADPTPVSGARKFEVLVAFNRVKRPHEAGRDPMLQTPDHPDDRPGRRTRWRLLAIAAAILLALVIGRGIGGSDSATEEMQRAAFSEGRQAAEVDARELGEARYAEGLRAGRQAVQAQYARGKKRYRTIWRRGYREAERTLEAQAQAASGGSYERGHVDGYNEGYDEGYAHGSEGGPHDNSDNDTPGTTGDDDAGSPSGAGDASSGDAGSSGCDSNYEGACVPADVGDVDCTEIPEQDFSVVGDDVYGLDGDGDGDGVACQS
jgi:hypothetical protein